MIGPDREQTEVLRSIWSETKVLGGGPNRRIDGVREELGLVRTELGERIEQTNERLSVVEQVLRDFADQHLVLTRYVRTSVEGHDEAIDDLRKRVGRLEAALPTPRTP